MVILAVVVFNVFLFALLVVAWRLLRRPAGSRAEQKRSDVTASPEHQTPSSPAPVEPALLEPVLVEPDLEPELPVRRFVPGGTPLDDGTVPDFSLSLDHLFTADNGVRPAAAKRRSLIDPIKLSIQAGARPVTPLLERVVTALQDTGLEPAQTRPLVHSFSDRSGRSARVKLAHSPDTGDVIEVEVEPSLSPAVMASVMELLSDLSFDPGELAPPPDRSGRGRLPSPSDT